MIKFTTLVLCLFFSSLYAAQDNRIIGKELNPKIVHTVYVYPEDEYPTTVMFPGPIEKLYGSDVITDIGLSGESDEEGIEPGYQFVISHDEGAHEFTISSITDIGEKGGLNVVFGGKVYIIDLEVAKVGYRSVSFNIPKSLATSIERSMPVTPQIIASHLDKAKAYHLFKETQPEQIRDMPYKSFSDKPAVNHGHYSVEIIEVISSPRIDTLYFHVKLINNTKLRLKYNPRTIAVNANDQIYYSSYHDSIGEIPSGGASHIWFTVTGDSKGGKGKLSPNNNWTVLANIKSPFTQAPVQVPVEEPKKEEPIRKIRTIRRKSQ